MQHQQPGPLALTSSLDHVIFESSAASKTVRLGLSVAIAAHVLFFIVNWPSFAGSSPKIVDQEPHIFRVVPHKYLPPPPPRENALQRPERLIPIPDPSPFDPEPIRSDDTLIPEFVSGDLVWAEDLEIPDPPPDVVEPAVPLVGTEITAPRRIVMVEPVYPEIARHAGKEGIVVLSLIIGASGRVVSIEVLRGLPLGLTEAAVEAARQWVFEPSTYNGRPTPVQYNLTVRFTLN